MKTVSFIITSLFYLGALNQIKAQCAEEIPLISKYDKIANAAKSWDEATPASLCKQYYSMVCAAKQGTYKIDNQLFKRTQQEAKDIEGKVNEIIKNYNNFLSVGVIG